MFKNVEIKIDPSLAYSRVALIKAVARKEGIPARSVNDLVVVRKSIDARRSPVKLNLSICIATGDDRKVRPLLRAVDYKPLPPEAPVVAIVGAGPAGLFAALRCIERGIRPVIVERGPDVDARRLDLAAISREKKINPRSNYCFGEGGAGAFSDGKLYTRSKKRGSVESVLQTFVQHGASENILIDAHPHIGSDKLPAIIKAMRHTIESCGGEVRFNTIATGLQVITGSNDTDSHVNGLITDKGVISTGSVIMAPGHSARDSFRFLKDSDVRMEAKGIAVGVRLEHPQQLIDRLQYHSPEGRGKWLPAAQYSYVTQADGRGVYSFCMCPGGVVVPAGSADGELVVNGMSASGRSGAFANSGIVVELHPGDLPQYAGEGEFEMLALQEDLEKKMYEGAGNTIIAPAQRMKDFVEDKVSDSLPPTTYAPGIKPGDFNRLLPPFISTRLKKGFLDFARKSKGFLTNDAVMIGLESRTSSPVRILRDPATMESVSLRGLFPAGEGAGYAGGIVSAAIDGMNAADAAARALTNSAALCSDSSSNPQP